MENFKPQPGINSDAAPMFQNLELDSSGLYTFTNWTPTPRPCKDVLRQAIRVNRLKKGQVMPVIDKSSTLPKKRKKPMQGDIPEDMQLRRQKNREAAKKCRMKKRKTMETLQEKIEKYEGMCHAVQNEVQKFKDELKNLQLLLEGHKCNKMRQPERPSEQLEPATTSCHHSAAEQQLPAPPSKDIADSLDDLLSELQDNDRWCEELQHFM